MHWGRQHTQNESTYKQCYQIHSPSQTHDHIKLTNYKLFVHCSIIIFHHSNFYFGKNPSHRSSFYLGKNSFHQSSFYLSNNYFSSIQLLFNYELFFINPASTLTRNLFIDPASIRQEFVSSGLLLFKQELFFINTIFI